MPLFYTRKGDNGISHVGKKRVNKTCLEVEALGELDELNSMIGVLKSLPTQAGQKISPTLKNILHQIQESLFIIQANVAEIMLNTGFKIPEFKNSKLKEIEKLIDNIETKLKPARGFIISGSNFVSAWLDFLRAKSRKVERDVLKIKKINKLDQNIKSYLNRLSSLFFALARMEAKSAKSKEANPAYR